MTPMQIVFLLVASVTLASAVMVVSTRRMFHAALWLILTLLGVAILFALLESRFFTIVQVVVYVGAIAILVLFAVMLTRHVMSEDQPQLNRSWWIASLATIGLFTGMVLVMRTWPIFTTTQRAVGPGGEDLQKLGFAFVDPSGFMIPFEIVSVLLLAALIGAVFIAAERKGGKG
jgi:NADH-quinone oxidoreductase subunit J